MTGPTDKAPELEVPRFDPEPSIERALAILERAGVPFALAGRLAVWVWVPPEDQELTKDVDFAVPAAHMPAVEAAAREMGLDLLPLAIGGFGVRDGSTRIDFIDRRVEYAVLFAEAVAAAAEQQSQARTSRGAAVPVVPAEYLVAMKMGTGAPKDERDAQRLIKQTRVDYGLARSITRRHAGPAAAMRLDRLGAEVGRAEAVRYVAESNGMLEL